MRHILFVFLDGIGLGPSTRTNPLYTNTLSAFERLAGDQKWTLDSAPLRQPHHVFIPIDASLGVEGLPQSGTGQATLFTGINCAVAAGRHFGPFPHSKTKPIIAEHNIFSQIQKLDLSHSSPVAFANAYPPIFFEHVKRRDRWTVTTRACLDAGIPIRSSADLLSGKAISQNLTGRGWPDTEHPVPPITELEAGRRLARLSQQHVFTLFEYYLTDKAGHSQKPDKANPVLQSLDTFFGSLIETLDLSETLLLITSDHGNLEDLSTKSHTRNLVPLIALGPQAELFLQVESLEDVTPNILDWLRHTMS